MANPRGRKPGSTGHPKNQDGAASPDEQEITHWARELMAQWQEQCNDPIERFRCGISDVAMETERIVKLFALDLAPRPDGTVASTDKVAKYERALASEIRTTFELFVVYLCRLSQREGRPRMGPDPDGKCSRERRAARQRVVLRSCLRSRERYVSRAARRRLPGAPEDRRYGPVPNCRRLGQD